MLLNSLYGKTIENPERRTKVKLCNDPRTYEEHVGKPNFKSAKIINRQLVGVEMEYSQLKLISSFILE